MPNSGVVLGAPVGSTLCGTERRVAFIARFPDLALSLEGGRVIRFKFLSVKLVERIKCAGTTGGRADNGNGAEEQHG